MCFVFVVTLCHCSFVPIVEFDRFLRLERELNYCEQN
jgi:hypothetical protein